MGYTVNWSIASVKAVKNKILGSLPLLCYGKNRTPRNLFKISDEGNRECWLVDADILKSKT